MIIKEKNVKVYDISSEFSLNINSNKELYKYSVFFDLEHFVYKKPICIGVFGCCYYDEVNEELKLTQYMIENKDDTLDILLMSKNYFEKMSKEYGKKYIVTFSGNNDFTIINYLLKKYNISYDIKNHYEEIDIQKQYEKEKGTGIGLKTLEKEFGIIRDTELISGSNLAKTISKIIKDKDYMNRMPENKKEKILSYNEQDVINLFRIYVNWGKVLIK